MNVQWKKSRRPHVRGVASLFEQSCVLAKRMELTGDPWKHTPAVLT